jgi:hypothetical protein
MTNQPPTTPAAGDAPPGFVIDQRKRPADVIAVAVWTYNREYANAHPAEGLPEGVTVAAGPALYAELAKHTDERTEPRRWGRDPEGSLTCLRATIYEADDPAIVANPRGYRIIHGTALHPEAAA